MSEHTESTYSDSSTCYTRLNNFPDIKINEKLLEKIYILIEALINISKKKYLNKRFLHRTVFNMKTIPLISVYDYLYRIMKYTKIKESTLIKALIYIDRIHKNKNIIISYYNIHKLIFIAIVLSAKYNEDNPLNKKLYSKIGGITMKEFDNLEIKFCKYINYRLYIKEKIYNKYYKYINNDYVFINIIKNLNIMYN